MQLKYQVDGEPLEKLPNGYSDHYEGTPLDISKDFGAGPYHTPYRLSPLSFKVGKDAECIGISFEVG